MDTLKLKGFNINRYETESMKCGLTNTRKEDNRASNIEELTSNQERPFRYLRSIFIRKGIYKVTLEIK